MASRSTVCTAASITRPTRRAGRNSPRIVISARRVSELLAGGGELALLDVREQGVHYRGHPFYACSAPLSRLELIIDDLVPRRSAHIVVLDGGEDGLADRAARKLRELHYTDVERSEERRVGKEWSSR